MSKPTTKKMLEWWHEFEGAFPWQTDDKKYVRAVYDLIEASDKGPEVDEQDMRSIMFNEKTTTDENVTALIDYLIEKGVRMKEAADD